jgi:hypothetical protein
VSDRASPNRGAYTGLFLITLATLMFEILLTRIFSATMFYHFAFMALSVAMFGMTVGALLVYLLPAVFTAERARSHLGLSAYLFALAILFSFLTQLIVPFAVTRSLTTLYALAFRYVVMSLPFVLSGICVCIALTKFPRQVSRLYAADLAGAALGCILVVGALAITDGPNAVILTSLLASMGTLFFLEPGCRYRRHVQWTCGLLGVFIVLNMGAVANGRPLLRLMWVKGNLEKDPPVHEVWNALSRVTVLGQRHLDGNVTTDDTLDTALVEPAGWGLSDTLPSDIKIPQYWVLIDGLAGTPLTRYTGDTKDLEFLKFDLTNLAHYLLDDARVFVIGAGGGRDVLSALVFDQKSVLAAEINGGVLRMLNNVFGDFTGHLDQDPRVRFVNDEARSFISRHDESFDLIQISFIDTWAATASGAFVMTENQLYTIEAWRTFMEKLSDRGILSISRWYFDREPGPGEMYRITALANETLRSSGIESPRDHMLIVRHMFTEFPSWWPGPPVDDIGVGTLLVGKKPFTESEIAAVNKVVEQMQFEWVLSPEFALDETFAEIASHPDVNEFARSFALNISPPSDDSPFFFQMLHVRDILNPKAWAQGANTPNMIALFILGVLLFIMIVLTCLCIVVPLWLTSKNVSFKGSMPLFLFFASIGLGFMLVEVSQLQRLTVFLGHPTYGLTVVVFTLLLSAGTGSYATNRITNPRESRLGMLLLLGAPVAVLVLGLLTRILTPVLYGYPTPARILLAVLLTFPMGFFMGTAFPLGVKLASIRSERLTPWLWGINGAMSVCASVLGVVIALLSNISAAWAAGLICYLVAGLAFMLARRGAVPDQAVV